MVLGPLKKGSNFKSNYLRKLGPTQAQDTLRFNKKLTSRKTKIWNSVFYIYYSMFELDKNASKTPEIL